MAPNELITTAGDRWETPAKYTVKPNENHSVMRKEALRGDERISRDKLAMEIYEQREQALRDQKPKVPDYSWKGDPEGKGAVLPERDVHERQLSSSLSNSKLDPGPLELKAQEQPA